jgi:dTDP-4-dehydrorhamnose 3,5-epimerase
MTPPNLSSHATTIDGVSLRLLRMVSNARGKVREIVRADDADFPGFGQVHVVETLPGVVRAWFRHQHQVDQLVTVVGACRLVLFDDRPDSPTHGVCMPIVLTAETPWVVNIPPRVWHGFATMGTQPSITVQHNSRAFCHAQPDEDKRALDDPRMPIVEWA